MNILLVYPETPLSFWSMKYAIEFVGKRSVEPPLGLITVAAMLPESWHCRLVDTNVTKLTDSDIAWSDLVFLSGMDIHRDSFVAIASRCKRLGATVVGGGPFCSMHSDEIENVDHFVLNEAEITLPEFLRDLEHGTPRRLYSTDGRIDRYPDLRLTPPPRWDLLDLSAYATIDVQYSRGCPFDCEFCSVTAMLGHRPRCKETGRFIAELESLYLAGWRGPVFIVDDNFIGNRKRLKEDFLPALTSWLSLRGSPFSFITEVSINLVDDVELVDAMVAAAFRMLFIGIETPDEASLRECGKAQNEGRDLIESVKYLQRKGFEVTAGFIVGFDHDTETVFDRQIDFIQRSGIITAMVGLLTAETGTKLYDRLEREGRIDHVTTGNNTDGVLNFEPRLDRTLLLDGYRRIVKTIYSPREFYFRVRTWLSEYRAPDSGPKSRDRSNVAALVKAVWKIGIVSSGRIWFWRLMGLTMVKYPSLYAETVRMAIYGYHYRKVAEGLPSTAEVTARSVAAKRLHERRTGPELLEAGA
jgi:radical SAM superfamily enzyme YgiQ (UPF0313 family)